MEWRRGVEEGRWEMLWGRNVVGWRSSFATPQMQPCGALCVGWGEPDASDGAVPQYKYFNLTEKQQLVEVEVDARRKRGRRKRGRGGDGDDEDETVVVGSNVPLMWLRLDPDLEYAMRVVWTGEKRGWDGRAGKGKEEGRGGQTWRGECKEREGRARRRGRGGENGI